MNLKNVIQEMISEPVELKGRLLHIVSTVDDPASNVYMNKKKTLAEQKGGHATIHDISNMAPHAQIDFLELISGGAMDRDGIIVQFPVSDPSVENWVYNNLSGKNDVDGLTNENVSNLFRYKNRKIGEIENFPFYVPATALGVYKLITKKYGEKKKVAILGRSMLVGVPLAQMLRLDGRFEVEMYDTRHKGTDFLSADVVVFSRGVQMNGYELARLADEIKGGHKPVLIDVSILRGADGKICGEVPKEMYSALEEAGVDFTPVPGGVGLLTTHYLLEQFSKNK